MRKAKRAPFTPGASLSVEQMEQEGVRDVFAQQAHQKSPEIILNLGNGKSVTFRLVVIQPEDIETKTSVFQGNARIQDALNPFTLRDLLPSIRKNGMTFPAIGRQLPNGRYEALDGSRRRKCCIIAGQPYSMYITDSNLIDENTARYLSEIGNVYKQLSQYEQGQQYMLLIDKGISPVEVARQEGITKTKVYQARDAFLLPKQFYQAHASGFDLGRPRINSYRTMWKQAQDHQFDDELLSLIAGLNPEKLAAGIDVSEIGLNHAIKTVKEALLEQGEHVNEELFEPALACRNLAQLMALPDMIELLGLAETAIRLVDKVAARKINEAFESLMPAQNDKDKASNSRSVFTGKSAMVTSLAVKEGVRMMFRNVTLEQQQEIEKLIANYLAEHE